MDAGLGSVTVGLRRGSIEGCGPESSDSCGGLLVQLALHRLDSAYPRGGGISSYGRSLPK